jgi:hypothetical protein
MADNRKQNELGSESPASEEAKRQGMAGDRGSESEQMSGRGDQPEQGSNRSPAARHTQDPEVRKSFEPGHAPSEQGEKGHPSPHVIAQHQQGAEPRSGSHVQGDRSEEEAQRGEPQGEHGAASRHGRQNIPGDRPGNRS